MIEFPRTLVYLKALNIDTAKIMDTQAAQIQKKLQIELDSFKSTQKGDKNEILRLSRNRRKNQMLII